MVASPADALEYVTRPEGLTTSTVTSAARSWLMSPSTQVRSRDESTLTTSTVETLAENMNASVWTDEVWLTL